MSKFVDLYPNAKYLDQVEFEGSFIVKGLEENPCWRCEEPTVWMEGSFQAPICSEECARDAWDDYDKAVLQTPPWFDWSL